MNGPEEDDADLKLAIALSLESRSASTANSAIVISDSESDSDSGLDGKKSQASVQRNNKRKREDGDHDSSATELSDDEVQQPGNIRAGSTIASKPTSTQAPAATASVTAPKKIRQDAAVISGSSTANDSKASGEIDIANTNSGSGKTLGGIDRAALERERLARQSAREAANPSGSSSSFPTTSSSSNTTLSSQAITDNPTAERKARFATLASLAEKEGDSPNSSAAKGKERQIGEEGGGASSSNTSGSSSSRFGSLETLKKRDKDRKFWNGIVRPTASSRHSGYECFTFADVLGNVRYSLHILLLSLTYVAQS
jgi:hypothetical protein